MRAIFTELIHNLFVCVSDNGPPVEQSDDGWLNFTKISRAESGWYKCYTRHMLGIFTSIGYFLNVRCEYIVSFSFIHDHRFVIRIESDLEKERNLEIDATRMDLVGFESRIRYIPTALLTIGDYEDLDILIDRNEESETFKISLPQNERINQ